MSGKRKYYPNNWKSLKRAPDELFEPCEVEFIIDKEWLFRPGAVGIIRAQDKKTGHIEEFSYKQEKSMHDKIYLLRDTHDLTIVTEQLLATNYPIED